MKKLLSFAFLFILLFSENTIAQETMQNQPQDFERMEIDMNSNDPDEGWHSLTDVFQLQNIVISVSNIKRNKNNKIIAITIVMKSDSGEIKRLDIDRKEPIKGIKLYTDRINKPKWEFGVVELDKEIINQN